jgi:bacteriophage N4 adsorption protein B
MLIFEILLAVLFAGYLVSGADDLAFDLVYWIRRLFGDPWPTVRTSELVAVPERRFAIFLPAWRESEVIEEMLRFNTRVIEYDAYDVFVGTYPNDPDTQRAVDAAASVLPNVYKCVAPKPGPTTKADNLNAMLAELERRERTTRQRYAAIVLHDAEDVFHPLELKLLNYHLARDAPAMIQTPIYPLPVPVRQWTAGTYMDQFAEVQTKDLQVRAWVNGFVPSAGVATCIRREAIDRLEAVGGGVAFNAASLTEDYELGLKLTQLGERGVFVRQCVRHDHPELRHPDAPDVDLMATWAEFPTAAKAAIRQRTRWALGIVFQSRKHTRSAQGLVTRWLLFHDRKSTWTYPLVVLGYAYLLVVVSYMVARHFFFRWLPPVLHDHAWIAWATSITSLLMLNRLAQRAIAVGRVYGLRHAPVAVLRQPWDNILNIAAVFRALKQHRAAERTGALPAWDKTAHAVPQHVAVRSKTRLGEALVQGGAVSQAQLQEALAAQQRTGRPLGEVLVELGYITERERDHALVAQGVV